MSTLHAEAAALYERDMRSVAGIEKLRFFPLALTHGEGCWLTEAGGRRLLDLSATWTACGLGHGHPEIAEAMVEAARTAPGAGGLSAVHPASVGLAEDLLRLTPGEGERRVYLGHAGSDANDVALRACRHATGRRRIVAFAHGYHGGIGTAMGVSGVHIDAGAPADAAVFLAPYPNPLRSPGGVAAAVQESLDAVSGQLSTGTVACVIVEPILSDGGLIIPPPGFLSGLAALCRSHGVPLICDEVKMGLGRPGLLHAFQMDGITPDIVTFGKFLGGGLPLSAAVGPASILDGPAASALLTTAGNPICSAVGRTVLSLIEREDLPGRAARAGARFVAGLRALQPAIPAIGDVRGAGLAIGLELVSDRARLTRDPALARRVVYRAWQLGLVVFYVGGNVLEITPPLIISDEEVDLAVELLGEAIRTADAVDEAELAGFLGW